MRGILRRLSFEKGLRILIWLFTALAAVMPLVLYFITADFTVFVFALAGCLLFCFLAYLLHRLDDWYVTGIIADLPKLMDLLAELEEREVFPENEDTVISKLQSKVIKLVRILKQKNRLAEQEHENIKGLVSDISHQLKTPISNLRMYSQFLEDETLAPEKRQEYVGVLQVSVERLYFLCENMIKVSRLESGLIQLNMEKQCLNETVMKSVKDIYTKAKKKKTEIEYREDGQILLEHDRNWTAEAVFNLLDNAVKYAHEGSRIILSVRQLGMFAEVSVEDENGAIPEEERAKIFTRFYRGKNSRRKEGIGVGLYLSREIAVRQGGYMNLRTTNLGNVFSVMLYKGR